MRVLWLSHAVPYPPKAGFLLRSFNLLKELAREHPVDLVAFIQERWVKAMYPSLAEGLADAHAALSSICESVTLLPIESRRNPFGKHLTAIGALLTGRSYVTSWLDQDNARVAISRLLAGAEHDLLHVDTIGLVSYRALAPKIPASLTHHNIESHMMRRRADNSSNVVSRVYFRREARAIEVVERATAKEFAVHITCSDLDSERLRELIPNVNAVSVPNGVDCNYFRALGTPERANSLVFVGGMDWYPNVDAMKFMLREIWPAVRSRVPSATMDIAGSNPPKSLIRLAQGLDGVRVLGYVTDVRPLIDSAALYVCPIRDGGGTKLKVLDAFAMGKCVLAHPIACEGINIEPGRNVILATDAAEFADRAVALLADAAHRRQVGAAARALVESQYSFSEIGARFRRVLCEAAEKASGSNQG
jgi:polysaccharide biosynthesis protein PslH